jgi:putative protein-disulfide isomerase
MLTPYVRCSRFRGVIRPTCNLSVKLTIMISDDSPVPPSSMRSTVVYGFDPLCGWCFGFGPTFEKIRNELAEDFDFEMACGGLVTGERVRAIRHDADYLRAGLLQVEHRTGVKAGDAFLDGLLEEGTYISNSVPLVEVLQTAIELDSAASFGFGYGLSVAFYRDGLLPDHPDTISAVATANGLDSNELLRRWRNPDRPEQAAVWMDETRARGVTTYPSLFLQRPGSKLLEPLTAGAVSADEAVALIRSAALLQR